VAQLEFADPSSGGLTKANAEIEVPAIEEHGQDEEQPSEPEEHDQEGRGPLENKSSMEDFKRATARILQIKTTEQSLRASSRSSIKMNNMHRD